MRTASGRFAAASPRVSPRNLQCDPGLCPQPGRAPPGKRRPVPDRRQDGIHHQANRIVDDRKAARSKIARRFFDVSVNPHQTCKACAGSRRDVATITSFYDLPRLFCRFPTGEGTRACIVLGVQPRWVHPEQYQASTVETCFLAYKWRVLNILLLSILSSIFYAFCRV